jgi:hypothetical protein
VVCMYVARRLKTTCKDVSMELSRTFRKDFEFRTVGTVFVLLHHYVFVHFENRHWGIKLELLVLYLAFKWIALTVTQKA